MRGSSIVTSVKLACVVVMMAILSIGAVTSLAQTGFSTMYKGQEIRGNLHQGSLMLDDGSYVDIYIYQATAGEQVVITMNATALDAYVFITDLSGQPLAEDDDSGGGQDARLTFTFPRSDTFAIAANTARAYQTGAYTLLLQDADPGLPLAPSPGSSASQTWPIHGELAAGAPLQDRVGGSEDSYRTYTLEVPPNATRVTIQLRSATDLDLFVRHGQPMDDWSQSPDFASWGDTGNEEIVIGSDSSPELVPGTYFIDVANLTASRGGAFTLTAVIESAPVASGVGTKDGAVKGGPEVGTMTPGPVAPVSPVGQSSGGWLHPAGYFSIDWPAGFVDLTEGATSPISFFGPEDASEMLGVIAVPGVLTMELVQAHVPDLLALIGPLQVTGTRLLPHPAAGEQTYSVDAVAPNGAYARTFVKQVGEFTFVAIAITGSRQIMESRAGVYAEAVASLSSSHRMVDLTDGHPYLIGRWQRSSTGMGTGLEFVGGSTILTFFPDGGFERYEKTLTSIPGYGSAESESRTPGAYVVLSDVLFLYLQKDEGVQIQMLSFLADGQGIWLDEVLYTPSN